MFSSKPNISALTAVSQDLFSNHFLVRGDSDLKRLSLLREFIIGMGRDSGHSLAVCDPVEAAYLKRHLCVGAAKHEALYLDLQTAFNALVTNHDMVKPVSTFKLMLEALAIRAISMGGEGSEIWYGRAKRTFRAMVPYIESIFTEYQSASGVDVSDSACLVRSEKRVPLSALKHAMTLPKIKRWLLLAKDSPEREALYQCVYEIPGHASLCDSHEEEIRHFGFLTMMATELLNNVAPYAEYQDLLEQMQSMLTVRAGHIVIAMPECSASTSDEIGHKVFLSAIRQSLAKNLGQSLEEECVDVVAQPETKMKSPVYLPAEFISMANAGPFLPQMRALGYVVGVQAANGSGPNSVSSMSNVYSGSWKSELVLDQEALTDCVPGSGSSVKGILKLGRHLHSSLAIFVNQDELKAQLIDCFK